MEPINRELGGTTVSTNNQATDLILKAQTHAKLMNIKGGIIEICRLGKSHDSVIKQSLMKKKSGRVEAKISYVCIDASNQAADAFKIMFVFIGMFDQTFRVYIYTIEVQEAYNIPQYLSR